MRVRLMRPQWWWCERAAADRAGGAALSVGGVVHVPGKRFRAGRVTGSASGCEARRWQHYYSHPPPPPGGHGGHRHHGHGHEVAAPPSRPLEGVRILDCSTVLAAPFCAMLLADLGADVIKIERPPHGDMTRSWGPPFAGGESAYFMCVNRNKRSLCLDLKTEIGVSVFKELVRDADVVLENFVAGKAEQMGIGYDDLAPLNRGLVYASITGFGPDGPLAQRAGYDVIVSAMYGLMSITGHPDGPPAKPGVALTDIITGLYAKSAIVTALFERQSSGRGQRIDTSLMEAQLSALVNIGSNYLIGGREDEPRWGTAHSSIVPYQAFPCKDGEVVIGAGNDAQFAALCKTLHLEHIALDSKFSSNASRVQNREELIQMLSAIIRTKTKEDWERIFRDKPLAFGPIRSVAEAFQDPQALHRDMVREMEHPKAGKIRVAGPAVKYSRTPAFPPNKAAPPPLLGQHSIEVLSELTSLTPNQINALIHEGVVIAEAAPQAA